MVAPVTGEQLPDLSRSRALVVGPGWSQQPNRLPLLRMLLDSGLGGVLDADALNLLANMDSAALNGICHDRWVLTPHPGEFARLTSLSVQQAMSDPLTHASELGLLLRAVVVLKGHVTWIVTPDGDYWVLDMANPALATGGSGDVLAGIIGAQLARGLSPVVAARTGILIHAAAGQRAWQSQGWFTAEQLIPQISMELAKYLPWD